MQTQTWLGEIVATNYIRRFLTTDKWTHPFGNASLFVAQHGPAVNPSTRHQCEHTSHSSAILEDNAVPVAILRIDDGALTHIGEAAKVAFQDNLFFVGATNIVGTVADLATMTSGSKDVADHQEIVFSAMLDHPAAFQQSSFVGLAFEELGVRTLNDV